MDEIQQIQLFLEGKLSGDILAAFENKMKEDQDFSKEVEDYKTIFNGMGHLRRASFEDQVTEWNKDLPDIEVNETPVLPIDQPAKVKTFNPWFKRLVAVAIIGLLGLAFWMMQGDDKTLDGFSEKNYIVLALDVNRNTANNDFELAELDFENQDFKSCLSKIEFILPTDSNYLKAQHLKGHAFYKIKEYKKAIQSLNSVTRTQDRTPFKPTNIENAEWTVILAMLEDYFLQPEPAKQKALEIQVDEFLEKKPGKSYMERAADLKARL